MPLDPALRRLIDDKLAHTQARQWEMPIADVRKGFRAFWTPAITGPAPVPERIENVTVPGAGGDISARVYASRRDRRDLLLLFFHGGGYVKGGTDESDVFCRRLAIATRHAVLSVDYRLAPEHPFPAAVDDALAAAAWASSHADALGARPGPLVVAGESAGGNLAAVTCLRACHDPRMPIRRQVLLQPVLDFTLSCPSMALSASECLVPRDDLEWYYRTYYSGNDPKSPDVSPLFAPDLSGLPAGLIIAAEYDTLRDEGAAYAERLREAGVAVRYTCYPGMVHGFQQMAGRVPQAQAVVEEIAAFLNRASVSEV
jgi:acetyl esterase